jgi:hypothetical protein
MFHTHLVFVIVNVSERLGPTGQNLVTGNVSLIEIQIILSLAKRYKSFERGNHTAYVQVCDAPFHSPLALSMR